MAVGCYLVRDKVEEEHALIQESEGQISVQEVGSFCRCRKTVRSRGWQRHVICLFGWDDGAQDHCSLRVLELDRAENKTDTQCDAVNAAWTHDTLHGVREE
eukprot:3737690-Rhodomonas_salina.1